MKAYAVVFVDDLHTSKECAIQSIGVLEGRTVLGVVEVEMYGDGGPARPISAEARLIPSALSGPLRTGMELRLCTPLPEDSSDEQ